MHMCYACLYVEFDTRDAYICIVSDGANLKEVHMSKSIANEAKKFKGTISAALDKYEASVKREKNAKSSTPGFAALLDDELGRIAQARAWLASQDV